MRHMPIIRGAWRSEKMKWNTSCVKVAGEIISSSIGTAALSAITLQMMHKSPTCQLNSIKFSTANRFNRISFVFFTHLNRVRIYCKINSRQWLTETSKPTRKKEDCGTGVAAAVTDAQMERKKRERERKN